MENLNTTPLPRIGDKAPSFEAVTTQGPIRFPEDYAGRWIILFSHPSDFTPVCTSEFMTFAARSDEFEALNCQLVGLSVDGLYSHIAWLRTIRDKIVYRGMQHVEVRFPLIADLRMKVANLYGMIQPGESSTSAVRAVFFIDPDATIRAVIYYPLALGRNFDEIKRVLVGLQTVDRFNVALPADWHPGDEAIVPTASSSAAAEERMTRPDEGTQCGSSARGRCRRKSSKKFPYNNRKTTAIMAITQLTKTEFSEKIANLDSAISEWHYLGSRPAIVDFYATWCGPCRTLAPILEELSEEYAGEVDIYKVDIDREQELAAAFGVRSVPTLLFIPAREMPQMATGALPKETLREAIGELLLKLPAAES